MNLEIAKPLAEEKLFNNCPIGERLLSLLIL